MTQDRDDAWAPLVGAPALDRVDEAAAMTEPGATDWTGPTDAFDVVVAGRLAAAAVARSRPFSGAISILGPRHHRRNARRKHWSRLRPLVPRLLALTMDDISDADELGLLDASTVLVPPAAHHIEAVFEFARSVPGPLLVHCEQGLSRSGAVAIAVASARGADPIEAARYLIRRDRTYPNEWLVRLVDERFGLAGALVRAVEEERRRWYATDPRV